MIGYGERDGKESVEDIIRTLHSFDWGISGVVQVGGGGLGQISMAIA